LIASCRGNAEITKNNPSKEVKRMTINHPFIDQRLDSLLPYNLVAKGILAWKLEYNTQDIPGGANSLILLDDSKLILDHSIVYFVVDAFNQKVLGFQRKSTNTFIIPINEQEFYAFSGYRLYKSKYETFQTPSDDDYYILGLGDYSVLMVFIPKVDAYISGIQDFGNPNSPERKFVLLEKNFLGYGVKWSLVFNGMIPKPPVSIDGNIVIAQDNLISIVDSIGKVKEIKIEFSPISCSIGTDNLIYMVYRIKNKSFIKAMDFDGNIRWECATSIAQPNQPPIVDKESTVFLIGSSKVEAFSNGAKLWEFQLTGTDGEHQLASVSNDGMLLVSDCDKLLCINKAGEQVWAFKVAKGETIMTPPVLDSVGKVFIGTDKKILAIK
jgi:hypothetical protein